MIKDLSKGYLLFIEPKTINEEPIIDSIVCKMYAAWLHAVPGIERHTSDAQIEIFQEWIRLGKELKKTPIYDLDRYFYERLSVSLYSWRNGIFASSPEEHYRGGHKCICGEYSDNHNYLLTCDTREDRVITNELCVHYLVFHRSEVPQEQIDFIDKLDFGEKTPGVGAICPAAKRLQQKNLKKKADRLKKIAIPL